MASRSWNRVELIGNLTRDPELRYTPSGAAVCTFGLATNRTYVTEGEKREEVDFHRLVAWNKLAELCNQLLKKGMRTFISGRLQTRTWEGQDGQSRQTTEIVVEDMIILTPKGSGEVVVAEEPEPEEKSKEPKEEESKEPETMKESKKSEEAVVDEPEKPSKPLKEEIDDSDLPF